jgi:putative zinc finger/helix-turn-helix YgiT family protein
VIPVPVELLRCSECGEEFEDPKSDYDPLVVAYAEYRRRKGMVTPEQISQFRKTYGLTQKELSDLIGIGTATLSRYENGSLQEEVHDKLLRFVMEPRSMRKLAESDRSALSQAKKDSILQILQTELEERQHNLDLFVEQYGDYPGDELSGYRPLDPNRLLNMVLFFCRQERVFQTKLNKLLFYADFKHFKEYAASISGSRYAHATHGPVPDHYRHFFAYITEGEAAPLIEKEEDENDCSGTVLIPRKDPDLSIFSDSELLVLTTVKEFFKGYSATRIRQFSHAEDGYLATPNGQLIPYQYAKTLHI